jgi:hypothetical protein
MVVETVVHVALFLLTVVHTIQELVSVLVVHGLHHALARTVRTLVKVRTSLVTVRAHMVLRVLVLLLVSV